MTGIPDGEAAWQEWQPKPPRHWTVAKAAFLAGFAAAEGPWREHLAALLQTECDNAKANGMHGYAEGIRDAARIVRGTDDA